MRPIFATRQFSLNRSSLDRSLQIHRAENARLQAELATGRKVNRASDDPTSYSLARRMEVLGDRYEQYQRSISSARGWVDHSQAALDTLTEVFTLAYEDSVQGANDTLNQGERDTLAASLEARLQTALDTMNTRNGDEYLFAGTNSTVKPFVLDNGAGSDGAGVTYFGNANGRKSAIGPDVTLDINMKGTQLLDTGNGYTITESIQNMIDALRSGDSAQIDTALDQVSKARDHVIDLGSETGALANRLDQMTSYLGTAAISVEGRRSAAEDADMAETIVDLQKNQTNLEATLQSMASVRELSILNYLR